MYAGNHEEKQNQDKTTPPMPSIGNWERPRNSADVDPSALLRAGSAARSGGEALVRAEDMAAIASSADQAVLLGCIHGGREPDATPLLNRPASYTRKMAEYDRAVRREYSECHVDNPIAGVLIKVSAFMARYDSRAKQLFAENSDGQREWALLESGNRDAFQLGVRKPMGLVKQGKIESALACYGEALEAAPHRARDTYDTLATLCLTLLRWQRDIRLGDDSLELEVQPYLEFQALRSGLNHDNVEPTTHPREGDYPTASYSQIIDPFDAEPQPLDLPALRAALKQTEIPLAAIARAALERASEIRTKRSMDVGERRKGLLMLLSGRPEEAVQLLSEAMDERGGRPSVEDMEPLVWALRDLGATGQAVKAYGKALEYPHIDEHHYWDFLRLCGEHAMRTGSSECRWALALPHLQARYDLYSKVHGEGLGSDWQISYYLARAYEEVGEKAKAKELFNQTVRILEDKLPFYDDCTWHRERTWRGRMEEALREIVGANQDR